MLSRQLYKDGRVIREGLVQLGLNIIYADSKDFLSAIGSKVFIQIWLDWETLFSGSFLSLTAAEGFGVAARLFSPWRNPLPASKAHWCCEPSYANILAAAMNTELDEP